MPSKHFRHITYWILDKAQWLGGAAVFLIGCSLKGTSWLQTNVPLLSPTSNWVNEHAYKLLTIIPLMVAFCQFSAKKIGPPWMWESIHNMLDQLRECVFDGNTDSGLHCHRVTLFKHCSFCFRWRPKWGDNPCSGWLVPVERSGHTTRKKITCFLAPDDADRAQGVAGVTWARRACVIVENLPDIQQNKTKKKVADYVTKAYVCDEWLVIHQGNARSLYGIPVEVKSRLWGVIVLDSRKETFAGRQIADTFHKMFGKTLAKLLEKA